MKRKYCYDVTRVGRDDECAGCCHHLFHRMTVVCRQRGMRRKICPRDQSLRQVRDQCENEPTTAVHTASMVLIHKWPQGQKLPYQYPLTRCVKIPCHSKHAFSRIVVRSWWVSWQARKINGEDGCGHVKMKSFEDPKTNKICQGRGRARLRRKSLDFRHVPQPRITRVFQNPRHAGTMKHVSDGSTRGDNFGRAGDVLSWKWNHSCDTFSSGDVLSNSGKNQGLCHVRHTWDQTSCRTRSHKDPTGDLALLTRIQIDRTRQWNTFPSCVCETLDLKSFSQWHLGTARECFQLVERTRRGREWCHWPPFCTSCSVLKTRTRAMPAPLRRVGNMVNPLSPKALLAVLNNFAAAGSLKSTHVCLGKSLLTHWKRPWSMRTDPSRTSLLARPPVSWDAITNEHHGRCGTSDGARSFCIRGTLTVCMYVKRKTRRNTIKWG